MGVGRKTFKAAVGDSAAAVMLPRCSNHTFPDVIDRFTYEIAPVFVLMEQLTLKKMREIIGWPGGEGDGLFSPGLSIYNIRSVHIQTVFVISP